MTKSLKYSCGQWANQIEETFIIVTLGLMTLITLSNVIARYIFNDNLLWAVELTVFLFAWLVLIGASYCVKTKMHLGIDLFLSQIPRAWRRIVGFFAAVACILFSILLLKGSWDYWYPFVTTRAFLETEDVPMPNLLQFLSVWLNEGERYEKLPRFIPYFALPLGSLLLVFRFCQLGWQIACGGGDRLIQGFEEDNPSNKV